MAYASNHDHELVRWATSNQIHQSTLEKLQNEGYELQDLMTITDEDCDHLQLPLAHRRRLLNAVDQLKTTHKGTVYIRVQLLKL